MMGKTFDKDSDDTHNIWIFPFANLVLRYERLLSSKKMQKYRSGTAARSCSHHFACLFICTSVQFAVNLLAAFDEVD